MTHPQVECDLRVIGQKLQQQLELSLPVLAPLRFEEIELRQTSKRVHVPSLQQWLENLLTPDQKAPEQWREDWQRKFELLLQFLPYHPEIAFNLGMSHGGRRGEVSYSVGRRDFKMKEGETLGVKARLLMELVLRADWKLPLTWADEADRLGVSSWIRAGRLPMSGRMIVEDLVKEGWAVVRDGSDGSYVMASYAMERVTPTLNGYPFMVPFSPSLKEGE
jgi:hypothetical protein